MHNASKLLARIEQEIKQIHYTRKPATLYDPIRYVLSLGGKRTRPVLLLLAYQMYESRIEKAISSALAIEIYHNYTLLHDDLMDKASVRRGQPTAHKVWNDNQAILSGDSMLVLAFQQIAQCQSENLKEILDLFTTTALEIGEGQQLDMEFEQRNHVSEEEYIEMIRLKTSVLLACALKTGAILGGAPVEDANQLYHFGEQIGLAFQLQDDYLDVYGDELTFGKRIGGDILCNKKTFLLINALERAEGEEKRKLQKWLSTYNNPIQKIAQITEIYNHLEIPALCNKKIEYYFVQAHASLAKLNILESSKTLLWEYVSSLINRKS